MTLVEVVSFDPHHGTSPSGFVVKHVKERCDKPWSRFVLTSLVRDIGLTSELLIKGGFHPKLVEETELVEGPTEDIEQLRWSNEDDDG